MKKLSKRDRRILLIGGIFAAVTLFGFYVALPVYESMGEVEGTLEQKKTILDRSVQAIENQGTYLQQVGELERELSRLRAQLLDAEEPAIAQNQLETIIRGLADQTGVTIARSTPLQEKSAGARYSKVSVQINVQSGMEELTSFLQSVSTHSKFLVIRDFQINVFRVRDRVRLQPRMSISAFFRLSES